MSWDIADYYLLDKIKKLEATVDFLVSSVTAISITAGQHQVMSGVIDPRVSGEKPANVLLPAVYQLYTVNPDTSESPFLLLWWRVDGQVWL